MGKLPVFLMLGFLVFAVSNGLAQDESSIRSVISADDLKKLEKAEVYKTEADALVEEANRLNMEVFSVQDDAELSEKAKTKKIKQLEDLAIQKQIEASGKYAKCNELKFTLYKTYTDEFWKTHENRESDYLNAKLLEEQSSDHYFQAVSYRIEAKKLDGYAKVLKLSDASTLELQAIQKQVMALGEYHEIVSQPLSENVIETTSSPPAVDEIKTHSGDIQLTNPQDEGIVVNQSFIDSYNRYISEGQISDTTLSTGEILGITTFDRDHLLDLWYEYMYGSRSFQDVEISGPDSGLVSSPEMDIVVVERETMPGEQEIGIITDENAEKMIPADDNVIYRVQIAANRNPLTQRALSKMYYGNNNVEMINENGWYKYSVGDFDTYAEASAFRKASAMSNAFVVAYRRGTKFTEQSSDVKEIQDSGFTPKNSQKLQDGILFRIQVAASRVPLTIAQLRRIYTGYHSLEMVSEDGWFKYQYMGVRLYSDALELIRNVNTSGAFIVAYENGIKADLADAIKNNKELEAKVRGQGQRGIIDEIEFHIQLAASKIPIPAHEISALYNGPEPITVVYEDGWYKYHIRAGQSASEAIGVRKSVTVPGAFIVAYKKAVKVNAYQAIQETK